MDAANHGRSQVALTVLLVSGAGSVRAQPGANPNSSSVDRRNFVFTASVPETGGPYEKPEARVAFSNS